MADYVVTHRASATIGFAATNASGELARNVQLEINQPKDAGIAFMGEEDLPEFVTDKRPALTLEQLSQFQDEYWKKQEEGL